MRWTLLLLLAGCPDRGAASPEDDLVLPIVDEGRGVVAVEGAREHITLDADGRIWRGTVRVVTEQLARPNDPASIEPPCTYVEPLCIRAPLSAFASDGRLVAGRRGRQYGERRIVGEVRYGGTMQQDTLVFASRDTQARALVDVVHATGGAIMVQPGGVTALGLDFSEDAAQVQSARTVVRIRLAPTTDVLQELETAPRTRACGAYELNYPIHLNVVEGVTVQQLVDAIVRLRLAGVRTIGLGNA